MITHKIKVLKTFKESFHKKEIVELKTPASEGICEVDLNLKETYLLTNRLSSNRQLEIYLCSWHELWGDETTKNIRKAKKKC